MKELKKVSDWYAAVTHMLTSAFSFWIVVSFLSALGGVFGAMFFGLHAGDVGVVISAYIIMLISIWIAVYLSSRFLKKRYVIDLSAKKGIIKFSTIYAGIFLLLYILFQLTSDGETIIGLIISFVPCIIVFYFASKKFIPITSSSPPEAVSVKN